MNTSQKTVIVATVTTSLAFLTVLLRLWAWHLSGKGKTATPENVLMIVSMLLSTVFTVTLWQEIRYGLGTPYVPGDSMEDYILFQKWLFVGAYAFGMSITIAKSSILVQLLKILVLRSHQILCWIALVSSILSGLYNIIMVTFLCVPVQNFWDKTIPNGHCQPLKGSVGPYLVGLLSDIMVWALPVYVFHSLNMPPRQKRFLMVIFGLGVFVCVTPVIRLVEIMDQSKHTQGVGAPNYRKYVPIILLWRSVEINTGIVCGNLTTLTPLIKQFWPHFLVAGRPLDRDKENQAGRGLHVSPAINRSFNYSNATTQVSVSNPEEDELFFNGMGK